MNDIKPRIKFLEYLPALFSSSVDENYETMLEKLLYPFEVLFEELQTSLEGKIIDSIEDQDVLEGGIAELFDYEKAFIEPELVKDEEEKLYKLKNSFHYYTGHKKILTELDKDYLTQKLLRESDTKEYEKFALEYLEYLASWIGLPLRKDKSSNWNRDFMKEAISIYHNRGTQKTIDEMIRAWLKGEIISDNKKIISDFVNVNVPLNESGTAFRIGDISTIGVDTYIGIPPQNYFVVYIELNPNYEKLKTLKDHVKVYEALRFIVDIEKPVHTFYRLRIKSHLMQIAPDLDLQVIKKDYPNTARIGETTLLLNSTIIWDENIY